MKFYLIYRNDNTGHELSTPVTFDDNFNDVAVNAWILGFSQGLGKDKFTSKEVVNAVHQSIKTAIKVKDEGDEALAANFMKRAVLAAAALAMNGNTEVVAIRYERKAGAYLVTLDGVETFEQAQALAKGAPVGN